MSDQPVMYARQYRYSEFGRGFERVEPTGKCKRVTVTIEGFDRVYDYVEVYRTLFGFKFGTKWISKDDIEIRTEKEEIYNCDESSTEPQDCPDKCSTCGQPRGFCGQC